MQNLRCDSLGSASGDTRAHGGGLAALLHGFEATVALAHLAKAVGGASVNTHVLRHASVDHGVLEASESLTLIFLGVLKFPQKVSLELLELLCLLLEC